MREVTELRKEEREALGLGQSAYVGQQLAHFGLLLCALGRLRDCSDGVVVPAKPNSPARSKH